MAVSRRRLLVLGGALAALSFLAIRTPSWAPFFGQLDKRGWRARIEYSLDAREYLGDYNRALTLVRELVAQRIDLLIAISGGAAHAARAVTDRVPVVSWLGYP